MKTVARKERIDKILVKLGIVATRAQAQDLITRGVVQVGGRPVEKPSTQIPANAAVQLERERIPYVSRGGLKLEAAFQAFDINPAGWVALDVGAATGGFTDCLLQKGACRVFAVDVGYGQLAWRLRQDPRVVCLERTNVRYLDPHVLSGPVDLATVDVSFISLKKVLPRIREILRSDGIVLALVKPQFEVGRQHVGRGGIVRDPIRRQRAVEEIRQFAEGLGFQCKGTFESPLCGRDGNVEFFIYLKKV